MKKHIFTLFLALCAAISLSAQAGDADRMKLDTQYEVPGFGQFSGVFSPTKSGPLLVKSIDYNYPQPFADEAHTMPLEYSHHWFEGGQGYVIYVEAGETYYLHTPMTNLNTGASTFYLSMDEVASLRYACNRTEGETFAVTDGAQLSLVFNQHIDFGHVTVACGTMHEALSANVMVNTMSFDLKNILHSWLTSGNCKPGDDLFVTISDLKSHIDPSISAETDGNLVLKFKMPAMPVQLVSTNFAGKAFKSFWEEGNAEGLFSLRFDGSLLEDPDQAPVLCLNYGAIDNEEAGYYTENVKGVCLGETLTFDLTGKIRTSASMLGTGESFDFITLHVIGVRSADGEFVFSEGQGTLGSFTFEVPFNEISYRFYNEITPGDGNLLGHDCIEVWVNKLETIAFSKANFWILPKGAGQATTKSVLKQQMTISDEGKLGATILIPIPTEALVEGEVVLTFPDLVTADGKDHSDLFTASYHNVLTEAIASPTTSTNRAAYDLYGRRLGSSASLPLVIIGGRKQLRP